MKIATFNVNGVNGRLPVLLRWLQEAKPDVVCLQELKASHEKFPISAIRDAGYGAVWQGQKSWNGVAILARGSEPLETRRGLPGDPDDTHSRYLEAAVDGLLVGCLYLPNGNPAPGAKFEYKLRWFDRLLEHAHGLLCRDLPIVLAGDYNVMPTELDVYKPEKWVDDALFRPEVRECFRKLVDQGWADAIRALHPDERIYTFWDYLRNAYGRNAGLRLDHLLLSPKLATRLVRAEVDKEVRGWEKASDHAPVWIELGKAKVRAKAQKKAAARRAKTKDSEQSEAASPLGKYKAKRNFAKTPEPGPQIGDASGRSFVVQEHHARRHHFDFRLEIDGVLVSWAVPKGIPEDLVAKRLAVHVEDHPLEYGKFEGVIPEGNYGAGTVAIWDKGTWEPMDKGWRKDFAKGTLKFHLRGDRLSGPYLLARMKEEPNWMLKKLEPSTHPQPSFEAERETPRYVAPQLAQVVSTVPAGRDVVHELKFDGYRLIVVKHRGQLTVYTRNGHDWTDKFRPLAKHLTAVSKKDFILDGEAVVWDEKGRSNFGDLQAALKGRPNEISFVAFDLLHFDGFNLRDLPLAERQKRLAEVVGEEGTVKRSTTWSPEMGADLYRQACKLGLEGIITKKLSGTYKPGDRRDWTKSKCRPRQEFIVCGYTPPKSSLPGFSSLVLGTFENGKLVPRGKVGTGFTEDDRREYLALLKPLKTSKPAFPFDEEVIWLKPIKVAEVVFAEITRDGSVRQASFVAFREDKSPDEVHMDAVQTATADGKGAKVAGIAISNPDRMVFPGDGVAKLEVAKYYERVGELMLPFVANRPLALLRAPAGITGELFFQKSFTTHIPDGVKQAKLPDGDDIFFIKDVKGLVSLAQFSAIEFHPWGAPLKNVEKPDFLTWDLDPEESVPWKEVLGAALLLRDFLRERDLETVVKTSGGKGLHIMLHLKPNHDWTVMKPFAKAVASAVAAFNPSRFTVTSTKSKRTGRIYIDWMRNGRGATCIAPWGLRARPGATVSMPINWAQLPELAKAGFTIHQPPEYPKEWEQLQPHTIPMALLKDLGVA
ncbi:DNA ligase D [Luteolibacter sp. GHJ8]|uniref:DNA ligase (ATP) n=1 Tax=Luteolibacter rhizosphaerae TaxID=2989719 RepID=A0ABT3G0D5_9BACT|nr:DNA ligase D [Luteolibacter rhizosphaerae]MCW1912976.1 DNA ligase D [Luteolibacter rhizosphaerae]